VSGLEQIGDMMWSRFHNCNLTLLTPCDVINEKPVWANLNPTLTSTGREVCRSWLHKKKKNYDVRGLAEEEWCNGQIIDIVKVIRKFYACPPPDALKELSKSR